MTNRRSFIRIVFTLGVGLAVLHPSSADILGLERVATGLTQPVFATFAPGDADRLFVVEKGGLVKILNLDTGLVNATPFLTIPDTDDAGEGGLIGLAFHPDYPSNGRFFVYVNVDNGGLVIDGVVSPFSSHIREYTVSVDPDIANPAPTEIVSWVQPRANHNGGWIGFDPNSIGPSLLYVMSGDGGKQSDPDNNAQTIVNEPLGKVLRIDVDGDDFPADATRNYAIPSSNPFVGIAGDDEIWAYGLRNPWRASFDRHTGDLWIADVGQNSFEEVNFQPASSTGGENYAWRRREGLSSHLGGALLPGDIQPVYDYGHGSGDFQGNSVIGGYVYRGPDLDLYGHYFFGDSESDHVWCAQAKPFGPVQLIDSLLTPDVGTFDRVVSFGEDMAGNLYIVDLDGDLFRLVTTPPPPLGASPWTVTALAMGLFVIGAFAARRVRIRRSFR